MNKALLRQLKRTIGIGDEAALAAYLDTLSSCATGSDPALQGLLSGFADLLQRVDASYEQYDRDLELRTRSLELSSRELSSSNDKLRSELISRENALGSLRDAIFGLLPANEGRTETLLEDNIESLSRRIAELVADGEKGGWHWPIRNSPSTSTPSSVLPTPVASSFMPMTVSARSAAIARTS